MDIMEKIKNRSKLEWLKNPKLSHKEASYLAVKKMIAENPKKEKEILKAFSEYAEEGRNE